MTELHAASARPDRVADRRRLVAGETRRPVDDSVGDSRPNGWRPSPRYLPIAEHGVIGDLRSAALVGTDGTIDWYCAERFDGPSMFASLLDRANGGFYRIAPIDPLASSKQLYMPDTNVLITRFLSPEGVAEVQDFMAVDKGPQRLIRRVVGVRGVLRFRLELQPRFDYGRLRPTVRPSPEGAAFHAPGFAAALASPVPLEITQEGVTADFELGADEARTIVFQSSEEARLLAEPEAARLMHDTSIFWRDWLRQSRYQGRWREMVHRSALTLKLLSYRPSGAIVAAPTTSLPERIGGQRNWDYRYTWVRDFAFSIRALSTLGFTAEAAAFNAFGHAISQGATPRDGESPLQVMYRIDGTHRLDEEELAHLEGYHGSRPVRSGNGAARQLQLDIYGELIDSMYISEQQALAGDGKLVPYEGWQVLTRLLGWLCAHWQEPDEGIWETRSGRQRFTHSRLMCWVLWWPSRPPLRPRGATAIVLDGRELGHVHTDRRTLDLPLPDDRRKQVLAEGRANKWFSNWVSKPLTNDADVQDAIALLRESYDELRATQHQPSRPQGASK